MAQQAYEDACIRAELFGHPKPDKEEFLSANKHLDVVEFEDEEVKQLSSETGLLNEDLKATAGGLSELNTILDSTQTKLNKLKGVCGSVTNFLRAKFHHKENLSYSTEQSYVGQSSHDDHKQASETTKDKPDINSVIEDLDAINERAVPLKNAGIAMGIGVKAQMGKVDQVLLHADKAKCSLENQNNEIRSHFKK